MNIEQKDIEQLNSQNTKLTTTPFFKGYQPSFYFHTEKELKQAIENFRRNLDGEHTKTLKGEK